MENSIIKMSRDDFVSRFSALFDDIARVDSLGRIEIKSETFVLKTFEFSLWSFVWDQETFQILMNFADVQQVSKLIVMTEIETVEMFTEAWVSDCSQKVLQEAMGWSTLPHFRTICISIDGCWVMIFDNATDFVVVGRRLHSPSNNESY